MLSGFLRQSFFIKLFKIRDRLAVNNDLSTRQDVLAFIVDLMEVKSTGFFAKISCSRKSRSDLAAKHRKQEARQETEIQRRSLKKNFLLKKKEYL